MMFTMHACFMQDIAGGWRCRCPHLRRCRPGGSLADRGHRLRHTGGLHRQMCSFAIHASSEVAMFPAAEKSSVVGGHLSGKEVRLGSAAIFLKRIEQSKEAARLTARLLCPERAMSVLFVHFPIQARLRHLAQSCCVNSKGFSYAGAPSPSGCAGKILQRSWVGADRCV